MVMPVPKDGFSGNVLVRMSTLPPVKSAGWSGVKVLYVLMLSRIVPGKRSTLIARRSGSVEGRRPPFKRVFT